MGARQMAFHVLLLLLFQFVRALATGSNRIGPMVPAVIVFGDSIVDTGNNNFLKTAIKCNFPPYGKDFVAHRPTGRFSNGRVPSDFIASGLGVKEFVPAYLGTNLSPEDILTGVCFASGATGYDPLTPAILNVITMPQQLKMFGEYKERLKGIAGEERAANITAGALYVVCAGTDDIANTYFTTPFRSPHFDIPSYVKLLVTKSSDFLEQLISAGAQKIAFVGLPPIGCVPSQRTLGGGILRKCEPKRNQAAMLYNAEIKQATARIQRERGKKIVFIDIYSILLDLIQRPSSYGFEVATKGCCGTGEIEVTILCNSVTASTCPDVSKYVFWDSFHPTERAYKIIVDKIFQRYLSELV